MFLHSLLIIYVYSNVYIGSFTTFCIIYGLIVSIKLQIPFRVKQLDTHPPMVDTTFASILEPAPPNKEERLIHEL